MDTVGPVQWREEEINDFVDNQMIRYFSFMNKLSVGSMSDLYVGLVELANFISIYYWQDTLKVFVMLADFPEANIFDLAKHGIGYFEKFGLDIQADIDEILSSRSVKFGYISLIVDYCIKQ